MQTSPPQVSIVIAVRDAAADLDATLRSIESQEGSARRRVETIVVDGASSDGTAEVARRSSVPDVVISEPDDGIYDAMNKGADRATGTWLHFLNAGDVFASARSLERVLDGLARAEREGAGWFVAGAAYSGGRVDGQVIPSVPHRRWLHAYGLQPHCHQATWFRSDLFRSLEGHSLQHSFVGDFDLILRFGARGAPGQDPAVAIRYLAGGLSAQRAADVPGLIRAVRRDRLELAGPRLVVDDALHLGVQGLTRLRRAGWWLRAAVLYLPKRARRRARARLVGARQ